MTTVTRRRVIQTAAVAASGLAVPLAYKAGAAVGPTPRGSMTLAWHTNIAPRWLDPLQHDGGATPDNFLNVVQDALIKNYKNQAYDHLALADHFEFAEDARSATFRLREGVKFHDGSAVTPDDVKWSYEHYHGAWSAVLHDRTDKVTILDKRNIRFDFKEPFLDFPRLMGTANVCGAAWVVPANYYAKVGQDGFATNPIGAGPYKIVSQQPGTRLDFEAFEGYYAPVHVRKFSIISVPDPATRVAMLEREEADIVYGIPGELVTRIRNNPKLMLAPVVSGNFWLEFPGFEDPKSPFHDKRVREAISLAIDREAINQAECAGLGRVDGNWINDDVEYALEWPKWPFDLAKAKQLMAEAGHPNGFTYDWLTPAPPYFSRGERIVSQLQAIGIRGKMQTLERAVYAKRRQSGMKEWPGVNIIFSGARIGASWANWYESDFKCGGMLAADEFCVKALDAEYTKYLASDKPDERKALAETIQREILENYYFVPVFRHAFMNAIGPRIKAAKWQDVFPSTLTTGYAYPWEEIELKA
ncbi:MAG TPA: ABC transporter substrate-binding protein [Stellaceae bacterium]|nr:ABC transporter substrate-binding protein [Stellaceae bacterium]